MIDGLGSGMLQRKTPFEVSRDLRGSGGLGVVMYTYLGLLRPMLGKTTVNV